MFLSQEFSQIRSEGKASKKRFRDKVNHHRTFFSGHSCACGVEVGEIQTTDDCSKGRVSGDVGEEFGEDAGMGDGDLVVEGC